MIKVEQLKNPASIFGGLLLFALGIYIATATQMSIGNKDKEPKELSKTTRITVGVSILLVGVIIMFTHMKKQSS